MNGRHEAHMTFALKDADFVSRLSKGFPAWKFSKIHGCPLMGPDAKYAYLTGYSAEGGDVLLKEMNEMVEKLKVFEVVPLRLKVERIVFDSKTGVNEL